MEAPAFWRDLQTQFRELPDPRGQLHALDLPDSTWWVGGGPDDRTSRDRLHRLFRALAERAAVAADLPGPTPLDAWLNHLKETPFFSPTETSTEDGEGTRRWVLEGGWINQLCLASAEACVVFETAAYIHKHRRRQQRRPQGRSRHTRTPLGRNIERLRKACGWSYDDLARESDVDKKGILRHVNGGKTAYPKTLKAYADAFSKALGRTVEVEDLERS